jgi:ACR3 family arsenite transporter
MHNHSTNIFAEDEPVSEGLSSATASQHSGSIIKRLAFLDRFLALWIFLAMVLGILLGCFVPSTEKVLNTATFVSVSVPIGTFLFPPQDALQLTLPAVGLIVMMYPILCKVQFEELNLIFKEKALWVQLGFSFVVNWIIAPLVMVSILSWIRSKR